MLGRIKRKKAVQATAVATPAGLGREALPVCPFCGRLIPSSQADAHHLVPKSKGGVQTVVLHRICHRQIHATLTEAELERQYSTLEALVAHPELARFICWVKTKPDDFFERTRKSRRLRRTN